MPEEKKVNTVPCPKGRPTNVMYMVDENNNVWGMCLRAFDCGENEGAGCPLAGKTRRQWHKMEPPSSGGCIIMASAICVATKGRIDSALLTHLKLSSPELDEIRRFRDEYIKNLPNGEELIRDYYSNAPKIVEKINNQPNYREIYLSLYEKLVVETIKLIRQGKKKEALENGLRIYNGLKLRYLNNQ